MSVSLYGCMGRLDVWTVWICGCVDVWMDDGWMGGWMDGWVDACMVGWWDGWMDGCMDGCCVYIATRP